MNNNSIEIATAHNIIFKYELASTVQRFLAWLVDGFIIVLYLLLIGSVMGQFETLYVILLFPVAFYHLLFETYNHGRSPGKALVNLKVVTINGDTPTLENYLMRWVFRVVDLTFSIGTIATLFIASSAKNQRIGDILAETTVISLQRNLGINLDSLHKTVGDGMEILYPSVVQFNDQDMLLVKQSLMRYKRNPNESNKKVIEVLADKMLKALSLDRIPLSETKFLTEVLNEYIVLTR